MAKLSIEVITAERVVFSDSDLDVVIAPGIEGELGILPSHAPLITTLTPGEVRLRKAGEETSLTVTGGFLEVRDNCVVVLAEAAERAEEIDIARAEEARRRAQERLRSRAEAIDLARAEAALRRSLARLKVAERRRRRGGQAGGV
ncbi:MAG: F0F1 ATP synthase subunit epsilon [Dehalococcoidia bacterium]|nr:F0F1 ATP synthase subunit epsilon [Dehalococcoidia bacterium]